jgi:hypothetical protein
MAATSTGRARRGGRSRHGDADGEVPLLSRGRRGAADAGVLDKEAPAPRRGQRGTGAADEEELALRRGRRGADVLDKEFPAPRRGRRGAGAADEEELMPRRGRRGADVLDKGFSAPRRGRRGAGAADEEELALQRGRRGADVLDKDLPAPRRGRRGVGAAVEEELAPRRGRRGADVLDEELPMPRHGRRCASVADKEASASQRGQRGAGVADEEVSVPQRGRRCDSIVDEEVSAHELRSIGLEAAGFKKARQRVSERTNNERFAASYGVSAKTLRVILADLKKKDPTFKETGFLLGMSALKLYLTENVMAGRWDCHEQTYRETWKEVVAAIAALRGEKIKFDTSTFPEDQIFLLTVDGVNFSIQEPRVKNPGSQWYDHKTHSAGLTYLVAVDVRQSRICWIDGPRPGECLS